MRLVLLDRDGVLNADREDSVKTPGELVMLPGVRIFCDPAYRLVQSASFIDIQFNAAARLTLKRRAFILANVVHHVTRLRLSPLSLRLACRAAAHQSTPAKPIISHVLHLR